jgi:UDP-N-acetyl-2-amino-2-deoxyglucuronate dehydrogenase
VANQPKNFALIGAAGYIAPRHLKAIRDTGNRLVAAADPHDSVGVLDQFFPDARFFTEIERFDRHLEKLRRGPEEDRVHCVSICSPNYLHDAHVRLGLRIHADVICEKPLVINPWNLDQLAELEQEFGRRINTVLQLRTHSSLLALKKQLDAEPTGTKKDVCLTYVTPRGRWYSAAWKGVIEKSGGVAMNIGIHFFDMLRWIFGKGVLAGMSIRADDHMAGSIRFYKATVDWDLAICNAGKKRELYAEWGSYSKKIRFTQGFEDLHTKSYEAILAGNGFGIEDARPAINIVHNLRKM